MRNLDKEIAIIRKFKAEHPNKEYKLYIETSDDFDFHDENESEDYIAVIIAELETENPAENPMMEDKPAYTWDAEYVIYIDKPTVADRELITKLYYDELLQYV
jgi:hypothetical protein